MTDLSHMPDTELDAAISRFQARTIDPNLTDAQRRVFVEVLQNAQREKARRAAADRPAPSDPAPAAPIPAHTIAEPQTPPATAAPATEKKTPLPPAATIDLQTSIQRLPGTPTVIEKEVRLECPIQVETTKLVFDWGSGNVEELTVGKTAGRLKSRIADLVRLRKPLHESPMLYRCVAYLRALEAYYGRELTPSDLRLRNRGTAVFNEVKSAQQRAAVS